MNRYSYKRINTCGFENNNLKINNDVLEALSLEPDKRTDFIATHYVSTKYNTFDPRLISKDIAILIMTGKKDEAVLLTQTIIDNESCFFMQIQKRFPGR